jgi:hypothetical protein
MYKRKIIRFLLAIIIIILLLLVFRFILTGGLEKNLVPSFTETQTDWNNVYGPLLITHWKQDSIYAKYTPNKELLGCWSIAFAQVLAYHRLQPSGKVNYTTHSGIRIDQTVNPVDWEKIFSIVNGETQEENSDETARYCFQTSIIIQKDFGQGEYMDISVVPHEISEHFNCVVKRIDFDLINGIINEIHSNRPIVAYFNDILSIKIVRNGHAAVLDGIAQVNDDILVHVNFGWGGKSDGWYNYKTLSNQRKLLYIFTIRSM